MEFTPPVEYQTCDNINSASSYSEKEQSDSNIPHVEEDNVLHINESQCNSAQENNAIPSGTEMDANTRVTEPVVCKSESDNSFDPNLNVPSPKSQADTNCSKEVSQIDEDSIASTSQTIYTESSTKSSGLLDAEYLRTKYDPIATSSKVLDGEREYLKRKNIDLYGPDVGPKMYKIKGNLVTPPIIANNLPKIFSYLPVFGNPKSKDDLEKFYSSKIREYVGFDLNDELFDNLAKMCSPEHLRTGKELVMATPYPMLSMLSVMDKEYELNESNLCIVKKHQLRMASDPANNYHKRLKYRGIRLMPLTQVELENEQDLPQDLEPGKDVLYRVRIYRPFPYNVKEKHVSTRHSIFSRDVVLVGRCRLSALRDRLVCANDAGVRVDCSANPQDQPSASAKDLFPSGFLFINNVFYVDGRGRCEDRSAPVRAWAAGKGFGDFPKRDLHETRLEDVAVRLGHPEVYVHQGNCEHLFTFSEIRLLSADDPLSSAHYPCHTAVSQHQAVYCTTCAEFGAKWIVTGCATVPFDPAFFCETCLKMYLYKNDGKLGDFKAYSYRGNEINMLKPQG